MIGHKNKTKAMVSKHKCDKNQVSSFFILFLLFLTSSCFTSQNEKGKNQSGLNVSENHGVEMSNSNTNATVLPTVEDIGETDFSETLSGIDHKRVKENVIIPGQRLGLLNLADSEKQAVSYLGRPTEAYSFEKNPCKDRSVHWNDYALDNRGVFVYSKDSKIFQIESHTERFRTARGIKPGDIPEKLIDLYPYMEAYELSNSNSKVDGGENILYWVDKSGIAFGLYYYSSERRRLIGSISIFDKESEFRPHGCAVSLQVLEKRQKWYLGNN